ncbi:MAG: ribonuclease III [Spirochaetaceae bacterium]|nr:ribonuclease III [Spirochaetaceae bacterium]
MPFIGRGKNRASHVRGLPADAARRTALRRLQRQAGIRFRDLSLLNLALCHRSYAHEAGAHGSGGSGGGTGESVNNEKLEFLGDAVLGLAISDELFTTSGRRTEGDLARVKSFVVSEAALHDWAMRLDLSSYVLIGRGEELTGGRTKKAILADAMEAVIGAYYLDSGAAAAHEFVLRSLRPEIGRVASNTHRQDFKTLLQQLAQKRYRSHPRYRVVKREGPDHDRTFWIAVQLAGHTYGPGSGKNKKAAEQQAAARAYAALTGRPRDGAGRSGPAAG